MAFSHWTCASSVTSVDSDGVLYVWFRLRVVDGRLEVQEVRDPAAAGLDAGGTFKGGGGEQAKPQPAVGGKVLLRREVVDVALGNIHVQAAGGGGGVHQDQGVLVRSDTRLTGAATPVEVSFCGQA